MKVFANIFVLLLLSVCEQDLGQKTHTWVKGPVGHMGHFDGRFFRLDLKGLSACVVIGNAMIFPEDCLKIVDFLINFKHSFTVYRPKLFYHFISKSKKYLPSNSLPCPVRNLS